MKKIFNKIKSNNIAKNFSYLTIGNFIAQLLNLIVLIKITRIITTDEYGVFTFLIVQGQLLASISDLGTRNIIVRTIARDKSQTKDLFINGVFLRILIVIILGAIYFKYNSSLGNLSFKDVLLIAIYSLSFSIGYLMESIFYGREKMLTPSLLNIFIYIFWFVIIMLLPYNWLNASLIFSLFILSNVIKPFVLLFFIRHYKFLEGKREEFFFSTKKILKESWPYFSTLILLLPINYLSNNFLDINSTNTEVGYFNLSQKITGPFAMVIGYGLGALFPNISVLWVQDQMKFKKILVNSLNIFIIFSAVVCFFFTLFAEEIITTLFTTKYIEAVEVSQLQIWFVLLMGINSAIGTLWGAANKQKLLFKATLINALISTPMLYYGSTFGALGLAYSYLISFFIFSFYLWHVFKKSFKIQIQNELIILIIIILLFISSMYILLKITFIIKLLILLGSVIFSALFFYKKYYKNLFN